MNAARTSQSDRRRHQNPPGSTDVEVSWSQGVIRLRHPVLFGPPGSDAFRTFLRRIFGMDEVRSVHLDRTRATASIRYVPNGQDIGDVLARMAVAIQGGPPGVELPELGPLPAYGDGSRLQVFRQGARLTTWEVVHELPGRLRFRHECLRGDATLARRFEQEVGSVRGVVGSQARPLTGSLLVEFDPALTSKAKLVRMLEGILHGPEGPQHVEGSRPPVRFGLANVSVGLAALGEFAFPALLPASAALLLVSNVATFRAAWSQLRERRLSLPVLASFIIAGTLATGQFLAAALMSWMIKFWHRRHDRRMQSGRSRLLSELTQHRGFAGLCVGDALVEVAIESLQAGDRVSVAGGEMIPADGRIAGGTAIVDERLVRGLDGLMLKGPGDPVFAGSRVVEGELRVDVSGHGAATRAAALGRALIAAVDAPAAFAVTRHGEAFAERAISPTLATAGLGLLVGDVATAAVILRPDYATGPGMGISLDLLEDVAACARDGLVVRDASAFARIAEADLVVFDHHPALERHPAEVAEVLALDDAGEAAILQYAASAWRDLADERSVALRVACKARGVTLLEIQPASTESGLVLEQGARRITVGDAAWGDLPAGLVSDSDRSPEEGSKVDTHPSLLVSADGRAIGFITFSDSPRHESTTAISRLRGHHGLNVGLISAHPESTLRSLTAALGMSFQGGDLTPEAKAEFLRLLRTRGAKVAYVGDCRREPEAAREAHVAISLSDDLDRERNPAQVLLLQPKLGRLDVLWDVARGHVDRVRAVQGYTLIPNAICVAGAFALGISSLSAVIITNLGTLSIDARGRDRRRIPSAGSGRRAGPDDRSYDGMGLVPLSASGRAS